MSPAGDLPLRILIGQTASGKNALSFRIATLHNLEIVSVDSMKIYRGMDTGTAKPPLNQREKIKYHLIDVVEPHQSYNVAEFVKDADNAIADITGRNKSPLLVCGTPLYLKALLWGIFSGLGSSVEVRAGLEKTADERGVSFLHNNLLKIDPLKAEKIHPNDRKRIIRALEVHSLSGKPISSLQTHFNSDKLRYNVIMVGLKRDRNVLYKLIDERVERMFQEWLVDEVKGLINSNTGLSRQAEQAVGYKEVVRYLRGEITLEQTKELVKKNTRHLARKQMTWFRKFPNIKWVEISPSASMEEIYREVANYLEL
ncbi:MAG: tRNA (adenosine(37)-N6)-dimethylallyltransferase MiaA [Planctomycetota bacterium]|nr:tRNA (adenosine(37)-N6)-dimethylallyltransferase MiaA [Planctomycetota bacterium]MDI6788112.1 tRNA (adenosine(37)-N6)-dimethylallyltransferase MiaA [Planctomycetota bacterium]